MKCLYLALLVAIALAAYDEQAAIRYTWASGYSYCNKIKSDDCGQASQMAKEYGWELLSFKQTGLVFNFINAVIFQDDARQELIVAFSGTQNPAQLTHEIVGSLPVNYGLHDIEGASVMKYFYTHYSAFSDWLEDELRAVDRSNYKLVFTGHSLGGALAVHAATDMLLENIHPTNNMRIYTLGQPRVGNKAFSKVLTDAVQDNFRIVHNKDLVVHIPPCIPKILAQSHCLESGSASPIYPFHTLKEVFYTQDESNYTICDTSEQANCSDKFLVQNIDDHLKYFGIHVGGAAGTISSE